MERKSFFNIFDSLMMDTGSTESKKASPKLLTWSAFLSKTSDDIDNRLIAHAKSESLIYIGGKCRFTVTESEQEKTKFILNVDAELYFKDQFKAEKNFQMYPLHTERSFEDFDLNDEDTKNQLEQIKIQQYELNVEIPKITG
jgi:hypothetical protein